MTQHRIIIRPSLLANDAKRDAENDEKEQLCVQSVTIIQPHNFSVNFYQHY